MLPSRMYPILGLGALIAIQVLSGGLAYQHTRLLRRNAAWVSRTHESLEALQETLIIMDDAETGQRGFLLTNKPNYLKPYRAAVTQVQGRIQEVEQSLRADPQEGPPFRILAELVSFKLEELKQTIALQLKAPAAAHALVMTNLGNGLMDAIRAQAGAIVHDERQLLAERELASRHSYQVVILSGGVFALLGLAMTCAVLLLLLRHLREEQARAAMEVQLHEAQKLETLGVLAGGMAHDFNNLLAGILGNANLTSMMVEPDSKVARHMDAIDRGAMRAAGLISQLLDYAGRGRSPGQDVDLNALLKETLLFFPDVQRDLAEDLPLVKADATRIAQVMANLLTNAAEAFAHGGHGLVIARTRNVDLGPAAIASRAWVLPVGPGRYVSFEVTDLGEGMEPATLARAFDPFFSTKFTGRGLGLAAVVGIVRSHEGGLMARSEPGQGTSFTVLLPVAVQPSQAEG